LRIVKNRKIGAPSFTPLARSGSPSCYFRHLAPCAHRVRIAIEPLLHLFKHVLVLPARYAPLLACRAFGFERAAAAGIRPIAAEFLSVLLGRAPLRHIENANGGDAFLCTTLPKVATEMALCVLGYNLTRVINIVGVEKLLAAIAG
jgi:hypothetical protein